MPRKLVDDDVVMHQTAGFTVGAAHRPSSQLARRIEHVNKQHRITTQIDRRTRNHRADVSGRRLSDEEKAVAAHHAFTLELMDGIRMPRVVVQQKQTTGQALDSIRGGGAQDERVQVVEDPMVAVDARLMSLTCTATPVDDSGWWWQSWFHTPTEVRISFSDMTAVEASAECPYAQTTSPIKGSPGEPESTSVHVVRMDAPNQQMWIQCNNAEEQVQALTSFELLLKSAKRRSSDHTTQE
ncbi:hypothetical protein H310_08360 [Aphanomyces invadans]|uniref:Uncharacterized protein n=1 Tax=Aphanomyces invadans TaxID=157072 RepID=A0A024TZ12_9STRA|nr:hypothetical protein H310_08360 [Aphanomyces invadans]ETV98861.1 hypothetical protein H310_08360 [Aphanomyces invadans]|eukprot:XP_008872289.1 hypothetical protein H310_08360 [Aphanomyces invadans]